MKSLDRAARTARSLARGKPPRRKVKRCGAQARLPPERGRHRRDLSPLSAADPEPKSELEYINPFTLLVAVVLSAQATDAGVNKATRALFKIADTPEKMLRLGEDRLREDIKTIGLYRNKARNVILLSRQLVDEHGGKVPRDREALEALPGVGRKTANVVLNVAFGEPTMAVDTHVFRVANRTGLSNGKTPLAVEEDLLRVIPPKYAPACPSLAHPARALRVQGAQARMPALPHPRSVPLRRQDAVSSRRPAACAAKQPCANGCC